MNIEIWSVQVWLLKFFQNVLVILICNLGFICYLMLEIWDFKFDTPHILQSPTRYLR